MPALLLLHGLLADDPRVVRQGDLLLEADVRSSGVASPGSRAHRRGLASKGRSGAVASLLPYRPATAAGQHRRAAGPIGPADRDAAAGRSRREDPPRHRAGAGKPGGVLHLRPMAAALSPRG